MANIARLSKNWLKLRRLGNASSASCVLSYHTGQQVGRRIFSQTMRAYTTTTAAPHATLSASATKVATNLGLLQGRAPAVLPPPSAEQQVAIDTLLNTKNNLIIDAMAGSGKTTTILLLAQASPETKFLTLVYNRRLMVETQVRAEALGLLNVTILNYHTLGARHYTPECSTDQGLKRVVEDDMKVVSGQHLPDFSVLVMDEQQDLTPIMKRFVDKILRDKRHEPRNNAFDDRPPRIFVLGDKRQEIYSFNNADSRFLTMANRPEIFGYVNEEPWTAAQQTYSNRLTVQNVNFINEHLLQEDAGRPMSAIRQSYPDGTPYPRPRYIICEPVKGALEEVERLLKDCNLNPADIIILAPSTRGMSPAIDIANLLALGGIPVMRSDSDIVDLPVEVTIGKLLVCTYHQAKGIERKAAIVLGFDQSYHTWYDKQLEMSSVSNAQYVAATRAMDHLILIQHHEWQPLPFVHMETIERTCDTVELSAPIAKPRTMRDSRKAIKGLAVLALCRNLSETILTQCLERIDLVLKNEPRYPSEPPPTLVKDKYGLKEGVAHITGTAIPAIFQYHRDQHLTILENLSLTPCESNRWLLRLPAEYPEKLNQIRMKQKTRNPISISEILYVANWAQAKISKDITRLVSIPLDGYGWITESYADEIIDVLESIPRPANITRYVKFEEQSFKTSEDIQVGGSLLAPASTDGITIRGSMDISRYRKDEQVVWEIKHMETLQAEHLLQVAIYMFLFKKKSQGYLVSARTGQTVQIIPKTSTSLMEIIQILVSTKTGGEQARLLNDFSDEEFLAEARVDFRNLVGPCALASWFSMRPQKSRFQKRTRKTVKQP